MSRVFNFSAGPAVLPEPVLAQAAAELMDWQGRGLSVMEMSHRSPEFTQIANSAESDLRELMGIGDEHSVLFMQGGATAQFSLLPLNLLPEGGSADYLDTGIWSRSAIAEAARYGRVNVVASAEGNGYTAVPARSGWQVDAGAAYLHYTPNETIGGLAVHAIPDAGAVPLVADCSSMILSEPLPIERFGLIYAGAQKNIGPAGLTLVIVRKDLLGRARAATPTVFDYRHVADKGSMLNTPPTFAWYLAGLVFGWLKGQGGVAAMAERNRRKALALYTYIDGSGFYANPIAAGDRSRMNVPFTLAEPALEKRFLAEAAEAGLVGLAGHRSVGGMRASLYNAMPEAGVEALIDFMDGFQRHRA